MSLICVAYDNGDTIWVTSLKDEEDPNSYTVAWFKNLDPALDVYKNEKHVVSLPCFWILV